MKLALSALLSLLPLLVWGTESSRPQITGTLESRQGRCVITGSEDVDCKKYPLALAVARKIPPGTNLPVTCQMPGAPSDPYVH